VRGRHNGRDRSGSPEVSQQLLYPTGHQEALKWSSYFQDRFAPFTELLTRGIVSGMSTTRETSIRWTAASIFQSSILGSQIESHLSVQNEPSPGFVFLHSSVGVLCLNHTLWVKDAICFYSFMLGEITVIDRPEVSLANMAKTDSVG
jgi:hypothetical protein